MKFSQIVIDLGKMNPEHKALQTISTKKSECNTAQMESRATIKIWDESIKCDLDSSHFVFFLIFD